MCIRDRLVGVLSAATRVLAATLDVAELSARRLRVFAVTKPLVDEYMRPRRPLPTSRGEPMRPYHLVEATGREALSRAAALGEDERFVAAASLAWPSHELCVLTNRELFIVNRAERTRPYARTIVVRGRARRLARRRAGDGVRDARARDGARTSRTDEERVRACVRICVVRVRIRCVSRRVAVVLLSLIHI